MEDINRKLAEARKNLKLTIEEVSEKTKIRPHILKALESGNYGDMPFVYIKSFLKTYSAFLKVRLPEPMLQNPTIEAPKEVSVSEETKKSLSEQKATKKRKISGKPNEKKVFDSEIIDEQPKSGDFSEIFKKKKTYGQKSNVVNYIIYSALALALLGLIYFTFFSGESNIPRSPEPEQSSGQSPDTTVIQSAEKSLFSLFEQTDSLTLEARATDTAWLKIDIDGKQQLEILMLPGMTQKWGANNYFIITQGNVGAVQYMRNGAPLEQFGRRGSVVKNIKITKTEITGLSPWTTSQDTTRPPEFRRRQPKKEPEKQLKLIEPSPIDNRNPLKKKTEPN